MEVEEAIIEGKGRVMLVWMGRAALNVSWIELEDKEEGEEKGKEKEENGGI